MSRAFRGTRIYGKRQIARDSPEHGGTLMRNSSSSSSSRSRHGDDDLEFSVPHQRTIDAVGLQIRRCKKTMDRLGRGIHMIVCFPFSYLAREDPSFSLCSNTHCAYPWIYIVVLLLSCFFAHYHLSLGILAMTTAEALPS